METHAALGRIAAGSGLEVKRLGPSSFLLVAAAARSFPVRPSRVVPAPIRTKPAAEAFVPAPEIVVTASKRGTLLPRYAGQFQRIEGSDLTRNGLLGSEAIESRSVGLTSTHLGAGRNKLFIRGIADSSFSGPTQSPVGQYFGDMRTGYSGPDPDLRLVDMESVEVLEGPQGTLYGAGTLGGIVLLTPAPARPGVWEGRIGTGASSTAHGDPGLDLSGVLNVPLLAGSALRVVGYRVREGGYIDNRLTGERDINRLRVTGGRAQFTAALAPDWQVDINGIGQWIDGCDSQYADRGTLDRSSAVSQPFASDYALGSLVVREEQGDVRFRSTTGASWQGIDEQFDASTGMGQQALGQRSRARAISNETRLWRPMRDGWSWLVGVSSIAHRYAIDRSLRTDGSSLPLAGSENRVREFTAFGEVGVSLGQSVEASAGLRYTRSSLEGSGSNVTPAIAATLATSQGARREQRVLPSVSLIVKPDDGWSLYARYQQGFRPGGLSIASDSARLFRNDMLGTAEAGVRFGQPGVDPLAFQGNVTLSHWRDIQADFLDSSGLPVTDNIGDGKVVSASVNAAIRPWSALQIDAGVAVNNGKVDRPTEAYLALMRGADGTDGEMRIPNIARVVGRVGARWNQPLSGGDLQAEIYARYVGKSRLGIGPRLGEAQGDYLDSGASVSLTQGARSYSLSVTNLADQLGNRFAFGAPVLDGAGQGTPLRPRTLRFGIEQAF